MVNGKVNEKKEQKVHEKKEQKVSEKYIRELREIRKNVKEWKCSNMGYNNRGITVDEGLEEGDAEAIAIYNIWINIINDTNIIFDKIIKEEDIKEDQKEKRKKELQRFFTDNIVKDILDGEICKGCDYHSDSKFYCCKGWDTMG